MAIPVIDFSKLNGEERANIMAQLHNGCEEWGFFQVCVKIPTYQLIILMLIAGTIIYHGFSLAKVNKCC